MEKPLASILGTAARNARVRAGLTQEDVAERIGMASEVYGRMERGQMLPRVENLRRLCLVLKVAPHEFLGLEALAGTPASGAGEELRPRPDDTADLRRLLRRLRKLTSHQVKLLSLIAGAMVNRNRPGKARGK
ncbi:Transcriptional regulator, contains XRE-family HTH domain [Stigmatella aurantiaca]|uniref:Transcriptional regulator, contains XRE-family HTH domain n=1 Tax=Stigmatella aurantiaca TaxID=41 RepID=A0A1H8CNJ4_STIAU|nr:helix-turn-helix transcriptional regulator [Stigmatella aurantiaca]SEM96024.1 Transcriptional regulator, contains XRE-family HTH domain [Stigmatella aurantiaca]